MTPLEQLQKEARDVAQPLNEIHKTVWLYGTELRALIAKAFLAGEKSGKGKAVDYLKENWVVKENVAGTPPEFSYTYDEYTLDKARK